MRIVALSIHFTGEADSLPWALKVSKLAKVDNNSATLKDLFVEARNKLHNWRAAKRDQPRGQLFEKCAITLSSILNSNLHRSFRIESM